MGVDDDFKYLHVASSIQFGVWYGKLRLYGERVKKYIPFFYCFDVTIRDHPKGIENIIGDCQKGVK